MNIKTAAARVGVFGIYQSRKAATEKLLTLYNRGKGNKEKIPYVWYEQDEVIRVAHYYTEYKKTMTKLLKARGQFMPGDSDFHYRSKCGPALSYSCCGITKHAFHRWHERATSNFFGPRVLHDISEDIASRSMWQDLNGHKSQAEYFYPYGEGAFIIKLTRNEFNNVERMFRDSRWTHDNCNLANYAWNKRTQSYGAEYIPRGGDSVIVTYLGWEELKRGGTFNSIDWYKETFKWKELTSEFKNFLNDIKETV